MNFFQRLFRKKPKGDPENPTEAKKLPEILPADLQIEISGAGTFVMSSENITIKNDRLKTSKTHYDTGSVFECDVNKGLMEDLFLILKKNKFDKIKIVSDLRLDYPSNRMLVYWGTFYIYKGVSQTEYIHSDWEDTYARCKYGILDAISNSMKDQIKQVEVKIADGMLDDEDDFFISCADPLTHYFYRTHRYNFETSPIKKEKCGPPEAIRYLPDYSELTVELDRKGHELKKYSIVFPEGTYHTISFHLENSELRWKLS